MLPLTLPLLALVRMNQQPKYEVKVHNTIASFEGSATEVVRFQGVAEDCECIFP